MDLGGARVHVLDDGRFALDGGAMFGVVPRVLWERVAPADARHRVELGLNVALIEAGGRSALVDTGIGERWSDRETERYAIVRNGGVLAGLRGHGLAPEDVDVVIHTHLHFDHAGGSTLRDGSGRLRPTFPRARHVVQRGEWLDALRPHERNRVSYRPDDFVPLEQDGRLEPVEGEAEILPGVRVVPVGGHTAHHQMVLVSGTRGTLAIPTDLLPTTAHLPLPWHMAYDLHPLDTLEAKRRLLRQAADERWQLLFYHDPRTPLSGVREQDGGYVLSEVTT